VLSEADKLALYAHLAGVHILGGFLYVVISVLLLGRSLEAQAFLWGASFILLGMGIYYLCAWKTPEKRRDLGLAVALSLSALLIFLRVVSLSKEQPLLFLPLLSFLLPTILVGNFGAFAIISVTLSLMQVWAWLNLPLSGVFSSSMLFVTQLLVTVIFALFVLLVFYVRNVYLKRLEENRAQLDAQQTVAYLSAQLVGMQPSSLEKDLESVLRGLLESYGMDCGCFFVLSREGDLRCKVHLGGGASDFACRDSQEHEVELFSVLRKIAENTEIFVVGDMEKPPSEKKQLAEFFETAGMCSVIVLPIRRGERLLGILTLGALHRSSFSAYQEESLKILSSVLANVLERVEAELKLRHMAFYDALTELPNRALFMDRLQKALQLARRTGKLVAVVFVDLDSFKVINDSKGHEMGDRLLKEVAQRFVSSVREYDTVARFGGDEFLLLVDNLGDPQEVVPIAERLLHQLQQPFFVGKQEFFLTASCGVAIYPLDAETPEELIRFADLAMYAAKARGGGYYAFCSQELREEAQQKKVLVSGLYRALDRKELIVYYQPQVDAATGNIVGVEALLRWVHPELGFLLPDSFIPLAEQTGLIIPIGEWVLQTACSQLATWRKKGLRIHRVAVNLSPSQLRDPQLTDKVRKAVEKAGIFPDALELEVTESAVFQNPDEIIDLLQELKKLGVRIALDDFGVGYSSLIRLKMLPVDRIKVDRRFFRDIPYSRRDAAIVENIIQLARSINAAVIAEGVENGQQLEFVVDRGCYEIQGYYYYHPLPPEEIEALLLRTQDRKD
jgi:diguanylate cyclase (GGDEF)-like protein